MFYDDEYNYLQHLKDRNKVEHDWSEADRFILEAGERQRQLQLPSDVFASRGEEEEVGLLNKAAPVGLDLSLDPEVVAAMDDDFNFEDPDNEFNDDFVMQMMGGEGEDDGEEGDEEDDDSEWEDDSDCMGGRSADEEDDAVVIVARTLLARSKHPARLRASDDFELTNVNQSDHITITLQIFLTS